MSIKMSDRVPLTRPEKPMGRFTQLEAQAEYVACMDARYQFAASGPEGQWLYYDGEEITALYPNGDRVTKPFTGLDWIREAQKL